MKTYVLNRSTYIKGEYRQVGTQIKLKEAEAEPFLKKNIMALVDTEESEEQETEGDSDPLGEFDDKQAKKPDVKQARKK